MAQILNKGLKRAIFEPDHFHPYRKDTTNKPGRVSVPAFAARAFVDGWQKAKEKGMIK